MARAFKCDRCGRLIEGVAGIALGVNGALKQTIEIIFSPEQDTPNEYPKDLCRECCGDFKKFWRCEK